MSSTDLKFNKTCRSQFRNMQYECGRIPVTLETSLNVYTSQYAVHSVLTEGYSIVTVRWHIMIEMS